MTRYQTILTGISTIGIAMMLTQPAAAMTCVEFAALDEETQMQMAKDHGWPDTVAEPEAMEESAATEGTVEVETEQTTTSDKGGMERTEGDIITVIRDECDKDPETDVQALFEGPPEK